jgi:phosphoribosylformylglycinamidine synthase subunit PurS
MTAYRVRLAVSLKPGLLDPQGKAVEGALPTLGWDGVQDVRVGKLVELTVEADDEAAARARVTDMAERFLSNPVIESSEILEIAERAEQPA